VVRPWSVRDAGGAGGQYVVRPWSVRDARGAGGQYAVRPWSVRDARGAGGLVCLRVVAEDETAASRRLPRVLSGLQRNQENDWTRESGGPGPLIQVDFFYLRDALPVRYSHGPVSVCTKVSK